MTTDNNYSEVLIELKTHYQEALSKLETQTSQIKTKLTSLDTLIKDPLLGSDILSILQGEADSLTAASASVSADIEIVEPKAGVKPKKDIPKALRSTSKKKASTSQKATSAPKTTEALEPPDEDKPKKATPKASPSSATKKSPTPKKPASQTAQKKKSQKTTSSASSSILKMNKPYDQMNKIDAVKQIMHENPGKVMHTDDLIARLFGELSKDDHKAERGRIKATMYQGAQKNHWKKALNLQMCYIYEPSLKSEPKESTTTKRQKSGKKT